MVWCFRAVRRRVGVQMHPNASEPLFMQGNRDSNLHLIQSGGFIGAELAVRRARRGTRLMAV